MNMNYDEDITWKPCKGCGSTQYDNYDSKFIKENEDGTYEVEPDSCDLCDLMHMIPANYLIH